MYRQRHLMAIGPFQRFCLTSSTLPKWLWFEFFELKKFWRVWFESFGSKSCHNLSPGSWRRQSNKALVFLDASRLPRLRRPQLQSFQLWFLHFHLLTHYRLKEFACYRYELQLALTSLVAIALMLDWGFLFASYRIGWIGHATLEMRFRGCTLVVRLFPENFSDKYVNYQISDVFARRNRTT